MKFQITKLNCRKYLPRVVFRLLYFCTLHSTIQCTFIINHNETERIYATVHFYERQDISLFEENSLLRSNALYRRE